MKDLMIKNRKNLKLWWDQTDSLKRKEQRDDQRMICMVEILSVPSAQKHTYHIQPFTLTWRQNIQLVQMGSNYCSTQEEEEADQRSIPEKLQRSIQSRKTISKHLTKEEDQLMFFTLLKKLFRLFIKIFGMMRISFTSLFTCLWMIKETQQKRKFLMTKCKSLKTNSTCILKTFKPILYIKLFWLKYR